MKASEVIVEGEGTEDFLIDPSLPKEEQIEQAKAIIASVPDKNEAVEALTILYGILRDDYIKNELGQRDSFNEYLDVLWSRHPDKTTGKRALRYMIIWKMLENNDREVIKLSKKALKVLDGEERMLVLEDLAITYAYAGHIKQAKDCLEEIIKKYASDKEGIAFVEEAIAEAEEMLRTGELLAKELDEDSEIVSDTFALLQNYPNPGNPITNIVFSLTEPRRVELKVFNILGQEVRNLVNDYREAGVYSMIWDGKNNQGMEVPSGIYLYRLRAGEHVFTKKLTLLK